MPSISGTSLSYTGEPSLDAHVCAQVGAELARARTARGLTEAQVGDRLLLSIRQVRALEAVDFAAFHNATFYVNALRKYAAFAGLDASLVGVLAASVAGPAQAAVSGDAEGSVEPGRSWARVAVTGLLLLVIAALGAGAYFVWRHGVRLPRAVAAHAAAAAPAPLPPPDPAPAPTPAVDRQPATDPVPATPLEPSGAPEVVPAPSAFGRVKVLRRTWIYVRDADGKVVEQTLNDGESFEFESEPTYLAVGSPEAELTIGAERVDVSRFVTNGQIRLRVGDFDALVQGASPIPAPTAAGARQADRLQ